MWRKNNEPDPTQGIVAAHFDADALARICELDEEDFGEAFDLRRFDVDPDLLIRSRWSPDGDDFYFHRDNGSDVIAVAHLDTVMAATRRKARFVDTEAGPIVFSGALDDRLGAYIILDLLPKLGINYDILLTVGEESGCSTAQYFEPDKQYNWMIEFDRGGTDVVMYQYDDAEVRELVRNCGAEPDNGIFSDISYMDHLDIKGFNWGVGYHDYHGPKSHAYLLDTMSMVGKYTRFHEQNAGTYMPHDPKDTWESRWRRWRSSGSDDWFSDESVVRMID